jgi:alginate biosynthesis protein AlgX
MSKLACEAAFLLTCLAATPTAMADEPIPLCPAAIDKGFMAAPDGWILDPADMGERYEMSPVLDEQLARFIEALEQRGVTLAVVIQPLRGVTLPVEYSAALSGGSYDRQAAYASYQAVVEWFEAHGVPTVDLAQLAMSPELLGGYYFTRDHHWTQQASKATAAALAARLQGLELDLPEASFSTEVKSPDPYRWPGSTTTRVKQHCPALEIPDLERARLKSVRLDPPSAGLLDEIPTPRVMLVGTSFCDPAFHFEGYLAEALSTEVMTVFKGGAGPLATLLTTLRSPEFQADPPSLLIWEWSVQGLWVVRPDTPFINDLEAWQQLVPAARGRCERPAVEGSVTVADQPVTLLDASSGRKVKLKEGAYLALGTSSPSLVDLALSLHFADGHQQQVTIPDYGRLEYTGRLFMELPAYEAPLRSITIAAPQGAAGTVEAALCPAP